MEFTFKISIENIEYNIEGLINEVRGSATLLTNWIPEYKESMTHDFSISNKKIGLEYSHIKYPDEFIDYCDNIIDKYFKLKVFL